MDLSDAATTLFSTLGVSFVVCVCMVQAWRRVIAPAIPSYQSCGEEERVFLSSSFVSFYPALTAPFLAYAAYTSLPEDDASLLTAAPSTTALRAVGISCGYMAYDTIICLANEELRKPLIIGHHVLSVLIWPYAVLHHRGLYMILFFIATEITNVNQHLRMVLLKLGKEKSKLYVINGVLWVVVFFVVRIVPTPYVIQRMLRSSYAEYSQFDFNLCVLSTPIPFMLNGYWFYLLFSGVVKFLTKKKDKAKDK